MFDRADAVELVDLTPDDLIQRLKEGKVYIPKQAERALEHFFSPANLTALRELALRRTAERVDEQLLTQMQASAIAGPWAAGERILVCISEDPAPLALYVTPSDCQTASTDNGQRSISKVDAACSSARSDRDRIADTLRLARVSSEARRSHSRVLTGVLPTMWLGTRSHTMLPRSLSENRPGPRWFEILHGSVVHELVRRSGNISVHVIAGDAVAGEPIPKKTVRTAEGAESLDPRPYLIALVAVATALGVGEGIQPWLGIENVDLVFLTAVVGVAVRYGLWPSLVASVAHRFATTSFSCLRFIPSRSPIQPTSRRSFSSLSWRSSSPMWLHAYVRRPSLRWRAYATRNRYTHSAESLPVQARLMTCFGPRPIRPP